jgi:hypothetical protein
VSYVHDDSVHVDKLCKLLAAVPRRGSGALTGVRRKPSGSSNFLVALQTWAEALRDPVLHEHARASYREAQADIVELAARWRDAGYIPADADTNAVAATLFSLMHGLIVMHHLVDDVGADTLLRGLSPLGAAIDNSLLHQVADPQPLATST